MEGCKICRETDCVLAVTHGDIGADLTMDIDNRDLSIRLGLVNHEEMFFDGEDTCSEGIPINYCFNCGRQIGEVEQVVGNEAYKYIPMDRELEIQLANAFLEGYLRSHDNNSFMTEMMRVLKGSVEFELDLMTEWRYTYDMDEMAEEW